MKISNKSTFVALSLIIAIIGGASVAMPANAAEVTRYITVSATGSTSVTPDAVRINATVSVLEKTSRSALATAGATSTELRKALTANKIAAKDFATQFISVVPEYAYAQDGTAPPLLTGYRASQSFIITVRAATTAGAVVDAIVTAGGDNVVVNGVSPFVLNSDKATASAREAAVKIARTKATAYAKAQVIGMLYANEVSLDLNLRPLEKKNIKRFAKTAGISFRRPLKKQGNLCMRLDLETGTAITEKNLSVHTDVEEDI